MREKNKRVWGGAKTEHRCMIVKNEAVCEKIESGNREYRIKITQEKKWSDRGWAKRPWK
jgi:hypothetical protein